MKVKELAEWAKFLNIPADIRKVISKSYDLILVLLGDGYLWEMMNTRIAIHVRRSITA